MKFILVTCLVLGFTGNVSAQTAMPEKSVIEFVTLSFKKAISYAEFAPVDKTVGSEQVARQPGFISRESQLAVTVIGW
ncbi:hypothetical protein [Pseudomonas aeruginosa]|uniref:hypothetical protein n=1 Tax=Pseudomonas aeruginosa TaxID=287 RepID=UPI001913E733|nr:hypothetical protein [Pseudomonas aeruginosa]